MRYTTKTEYGLICMIHIAHHHEATKITIRQIAEQERYPLPYLEKILQHLKHAGLVESFQGPAGGYRLARPASAITLRQMIDALEGATFDIFCNNDVREDIVCNHICLCGVKPVWRRTKDLLDRFFDSITLETDANDPTQLQSLIPVMKEAAHG